jgi:regulator of replication initiation timing
MRLGLALLLLGLAPLLAQNSAQFAGMQQDLAELRNEVEKLKLDNADLREALAKA